MATVTANVVGAQCDGNYYRNVIGTQKAAYKHLMDNVNTWLYYNSDDSSDPDDFAIEDFKEFCFNRYQVSA
jgi:hypothetical protein